MSASPFLGFLSVASLAVACSANGPPRPTGAAPFPMPNPRSAGLPHPHTYSTSEASDLVLDLVTGLEWQRGVDLGPGESGGFVFNDAANHCAELVQGGHDDFYLPTRLELVSILDPSTTEPAIDSDAFPDTPPEAYWTTTPFAADTESAYSANLVFGITSSNPKADEQLLRCVRNERQPELPTADRFYVDGGTVLDRMTGLRWEREPDFESDSFDRARTYCGELVVNANANFRVPSMKELQTIVDDTRLGVLIDPAAFPNTSVESYWSSTRFAGATLDEPDAGSAPVLAWSVRFSDGSSRTEDVDTPNGVRCVR